MSARIPFFDVARAYVAQAKELREAVEAVMTSGRFVLGPQVDAFEREFAEAIDVPRVVAVASGTDALELALRAHELDPGSDILCPNLTAPATATAIVRAGHRPVLVDVDSRTLTIDAVSAAAAATATTSAVVAVHLYGRAAAVSDLERLGLVIVEDAAQGHGLALSTRAHATAAYSFYPTKNLGAFGDGGAVATRDAAVAERVRLLRTYGETERHFCARVGLNSRLDELQAALLRVRLRNLDQHNVRRSEIAKAYDEALGRDSPPGVHHLYVARFRERDRVREQLSTRGIETAVHYPWPLSAQPAFAGSRRADRLAESERAAGEVLSLPCNPYLTHDEQARVADGLAAVKSALAP